MLGQDVTTTSATTATTTETVEKKKKHKGLKVTLILILILAILGGAATAAYFFFFATKTIDLSDCFTVEYSGYDGSATATVQLNQSKLKEKINDESKARSFSKKAELTVDNAINLSNGDEIAVKVSVPKSFLEENKLELKSNTVKIKVEGLEELSAMDLSKYINLTYTGYNKYATAEAELDSSLEDEIGKDIYKNLERQIDLKIKDNENLENGDTVEVQIDISDKWLKENGLELKSKTAKIKVDGLDDATEVDAFKDMKVTLNGMSPNISITVSNESTDEFIKTIKYTPSKTSGIANGETVKIEATSWDEEMAEKKGIVLKEKTTEYKVENQAAYVSKTSEITDSVKDQIKNSFVEKSKSKAAESAYFDLKDHESGKATIRRETDYKYVSIDNDMIDQDLTLSNAEVVALYLLTKKESSNSSDINKMVGIVRLTYTSSKSGTTYVWYATVTAKNFSLKNDGTISDNAVYDMSLDEGKDQESAYQRWVNEYKDDYNVESISLT